MNPLKLVLLGSGLTLLVMGAFVGLWSMTIAPPPPAIAEARRATTDLQDRAAAEVADFQRHLAATNTAYATKKMDRALAHMVVTQDAAEGVLRGPLAQGLDDATRTMLSKQLCTALEMTTAGAPKGHPLLDTLIAGDTTCKPPVRAMPDLTATAPAH